MKFTPEQWATIQAETCCEPAKIHYALSHVAHLIHAPADCISMMSRLADREMTPLEQSVNFPAVRRVAS